MSLIKKYQANLSVINEKYTHTPSPLKNEDGTPFDKVLMTYRNKSDVVVGAVAELPVKNPYYDTSKKIEIYRYLKTTQDAAGNLAITWNSNSSVRKTPDAFRSVKNVNDSDIIFSGNKYYDRVKDPNDSLYLFKNYIKGGIFDGLPKSTVYFIPPKSPGDDPSFADALYGDGILLAKEMGTPFGVSGDRSSKFLRRKYQAGGAIFSELRNRFVAAAIDTARVYAAGNNTSAESVLSIFSPRKETAFYNKDLLTLQVMGSPLGQHLRMRTSLADFYSRPKMGTSDSLLPTAFINSPAHFFQATPLRFGLGALNETIKLGASLFGGGYSINQSTYQTVEQDINNKLREYLSSSKIKTDVFGRHIELNGLVLHNQEEYFVKDEFGFKADKIGLKGYRNPVKVTPEIHNITGGTVNNFFSNFATVSDNVSFNIISFDQYSAQAEVDTTYSTEVTEDNFEDDLVTLGFVYFDKNLKYTKYIQFRAFLTQLQEAINPEWNSSRFTGNPLNYYTYKGVQRVVNFSFSVHTYSKKELASMWIKLNKLSSLCYPQYTDVPSGINTLDQTLHSRMQGPIVRLQLGSLYKNTPGFIQSLAFSADDNSPWEVEGGFQTPHVVNVVCAYTIIGHVIPELDNINSFDVFRQNRFDTGKGDYIVGGNMNAFQENKPKTNIGKNIITDLVG